MTTDPILKAWGDADAWLCALKEWLWDYVFTSGPWGVKWVLGLCLFGFAGRLLWAFLDAIETAPENREGWVALDDYRERREHRRIGNTTTVQTVRERLYEKPDKTRVWRAV